MSKVSWPIRAVHLRQTISSKTEMLVGQPDRWSGLEDSSFLRSFKGESLVYKFGISPGIKVKTQVQRPQGRGVQCSFSLGLQIPPIIRLLKEGSRLAGCASTAPAAQRAAAENERIRWTQERQQPSLSTSPSALHCSYNQQGVRMKVTPLPV